MDSLAAIAVTTPLTNTSITASKQWNNILDLVHFMDNTSSVIDIYIIPGKRVKKTNLINTYNSGREI
jgi:hypothetical protein